MSHMTDSQITTLRNYALNNGTAAPLIAAANVPGFLAWCNADSGSLRWLPAANTLTVEEAPSYTTYDSLVQGKRDSWLVFLRSARDFGKAKVRNWVVDIWGAATASSNSESVLKAGTAIATNAQIALTGSSKSTGTVTAVDTIFEEEVDINDVTKVIFKDDGTIWTL
jgi:hypothetical protein